jgi:hypothetical protein
MDFFQVKSPQSVKQFAQDQAKKLVIDAQWSVTVAPPGTEVGISAVSNTDIDAATAQISIFQVYNGKENPVALLNVEFKDKRKVNTLWRTTPVKGGTFEDGVYHFRVTVGNHKGATVAGLKLKDTVARVNESSFTPAKKGKPPVNING